MTLLNDPTATYHGNPDRISNFDRLLLAGALMRPRPAHSPRRRLSAGLRRFTLFLAISGLAILSGMAVRAAEPIEAGLFVGGLSDRVVEQIVKPEIEPRDRAYRLRALLSETLATDTLGRFALGRYWRTATDVERQAYLEVFEDAMVYRFMSLLGQYSGERIHVGQVRSDPNHPDRFTVMSRLVGTQAQPIDVAWRVRRDRDSYRVYDVVVEGVSIAVTLRSEYSAFIRQHGGTVGPLIEELRDRLPADAAGRRVARR